MRMSTGTEKCTGFGKRKVRWSGRCRGSGGGPKARRLNRGRGDGGAARRRPVLSGVGPKRRAVRPAYRRCLPRPAAIQWRSQPPWVVSAPDDSDDECAADDLRDSERGKPPGAVDDSDHGGESAERRAQDEDGSLSGLWGGGSATSAGKASPRVALGVAVRRCELA